MIINIIAFIFVLSILVFVHEFGHFFAAKILGVGVEKFSLGFGPKVISFNHGITEYRISAIPLGGYVKMVGSESDSELNNEMKNISFINKNIIKKITIVLAGPIFNIFLSVLIFFSIFSTFGMYTLKPIVGEVLIGMPADKSGIKNGDTIKVVNQKEIFSWNDLVNEISNIGELETDIVIERNGIYKNIKIIPTMIKSENMFSNKFVIGITPSGETTFKKLSFITALKSSFIKSYEISYLTLLSIVKLLQGAVSSKTMGGPIMIAKMAGDHARTGLIDLALFSSVLSINLAILNCLPIPILDGGHVVFFVFEGIFRKQINVKFKEIFYKIGAIFLFLLMFFVFYNDIVKLFYD